MVSLCSLRPECASQHNEHNGLLQSLKPRGSSEKPAGHLWGPRRPHAGCSAFRSGSNTRVPPRDQRGCGRGVRALPEGWPHHPQTPQAQSLQKWREALRLAPTSQQHNSKRRWQPTRPPTDGQRNQAQCPHAGLRPRDPPRADQSADTESTGNGEGPLLGTAFVVGRVTGMFWN